MDTKLQSNAQAFNAYLPNIALVGVLHSAIHIYITQSISEKLQNIGAHQLYTVWTLKF